MIRWMVNFETEVFLGCFTVKLIINLRIEIEFTLIAGVKLHNSQHHSSQIPVKFPVKSTEKTCPQSVCYRVQMSTKA